MSKWEELREAMKNPPEERLCLINANGYKIGMLAILVISFIIFQTVIWYISFIFLVQLVSNWVGYKREMKQYNSIIEARKAMGIYQEVEEDPSFTRSRFRLIKEELSGNVQFIIASIITVPSVLLLDMGSRSMGEKSLIIFGIIILFIVAMLFPVYWIAKFRRYWNSKDRRE